MNSLKRTNLNKSHWVSAVVLGLLVAFTSFTVSAAESRTEFSLNKVNEVVKQITGNAVLIPTDKIKITMPPIAEIGSEVGVGVKALGFDHVESISLIAEKNDNPMLVSFKISEGTDPFIKSRVKLRESTNVIAVIKADGKFYTASKMVKITIGGCGGGSTK